MPLQVLEATHTLTGLPWWASITATCLAGRAVLLPLSLKARQASVNVQLLDVSFSKVGPTSQGSCYSPSVFLMGQWLL